MAGRINLGVANPSLDANGNPVNGATLTFYQNGTTTPQAIYADLALGTPLANPLTSDSAGMFPEIYGPYGSAYTVKWSRAGQLDVTINDVYAGGFATMPTQQKLTSGSAATYTTPALCRQIRVRMVGGGGGGGGSGTSSTAGGTGGNTIFNSYNAAGGSGGGPASGATGGAGGSGGSNGTGATTVNRQVGQSGAGSTVTIVGANAGAGGSSQLGPGAQGAGGGAGSPAIANTGGGGQGGHGNGSVAPVASGGGGEFVELIINSPSATYTYTIGAAGSAGAAGTSGTNGGAGGTGLIIVDELY